MGFKENLRAKVDLDRTFGNLLHTMKEPPQTRWVDKDLVRRLLALADFKFTKSGNLELYTHQKEDGSKEVLVLDNELPIYHTTIADVTLRKNPSWRDAFSIRNVRKIMNDRDVLVTRGKDSLRRLYDYALGRIDLTYTGEDLRELIEDARQGLEDRSLTDVEESLEIFVALLGLEPVYLEIDRDLQIFGKPSARNPDAAFEYLVMLNRSSVSIGLRKGAFSTDNPHDVEWADRYSEGMERTEVGGVAVFEFLAEVALEQESYPHSGMAEQMPLNRPPIGAKEPRADL